MHNTCSVLKKVNADRKASSGSAKIVAGIEDDIQRGTAFIASSSRSIQSNLSFQNLHNSQAMNSKIQGRALVSAQKILNELWTFDTAASGHITADFSLLQNPVSISKWIEIGDGRFLEAIHIGKVKLDILDGSAVIPLTISDVLYIPN